jgi:hypothetical protein
MTKVDERVPGRSLYAAGAVVTAAYLAVLTWYARLRWDAICALPPNELGDFLAGAFSPVAFSWLVLGFIQQGIELRQNSVALRLQVEELKTAAEHAGAMVELQRKEFELRIKELEAQQERDTAHEAAAAKRREEAAVRAMQPRFEFNMAFRKSDGLEPATLLNEGRDCSNVSVELAPDPRVLRLLGTLEFDKFAHGLAVPIKFHVGNWAPHTQKLTVSYTDAAGTERSQGFVVTVRDNHLAFSKDNE